MTTALRMECWKSRRRGLWLVCATLLGVELLWILWGFQNPSEQELVLGWRYLLYSLPPINGILVPVIAATLASRIADLEHKGNTLKLLETIQPKPQMLNAKLAFGALHLLPFALIQTAGLLGAGFLIGFYGPAPFADYALNGLFTFCTSFAIYGLHLMLSLLIKNQIVPLCIGLGGSFIALLLMFLPADLARLVCGPYGFSGALTFVWMTSWDPDTRVMELTRTPTPWGSFAVLLAWMLAIYIIGRAALKRKEL